MQKPRVKEGRPRAASPTTSEPRRQLRLKQAPLRPNLTDQLRLKLLLRFIGLAFGCSGGTSSVSLPASSTEASGASARAESSGSSCCSCAEIHESAACTDEASGDGALALADASVGTIDTSGMATGDSADSSTGLATTGEMLHGRTDGSSPVRHRRRALRPPGDSRASADLAQQPALALALLQGFRTGRCGGDRACACSALLRCCSSVPRASAPRPGHARPR